MTDIELVIKVPKNLYEAYKGRPPMLGDAGMDMIAQSIANGTPLPKGHGRLIDAERIRIVRAPDSAIDDNIETTIWAIKQYISHLPTIIEADKGE